VTFGDPLDTNMCSCSDALVTNMCSVLETQESGATALVEHGRLPESAPSGSGEARRSRTIARRRRTLLAAAAVAMLVMLALPWGGTGGHSLAVPGAAHGGSLVAGESYVVHQGGHDLGDRRATCRRL
jgi:hypothetical protein